MGDDNEMAFEDEICEHLAANGWLYSPNGVGYDRERALFPEDLFAWLEETQPASGQDRQAVEVAGEQARRRASCSTGWSRRWTRRWKGGGTLNVLRKGFKQTSAPVQDVRSSGRRRR